jgi:uncharacterized Zn finger protein (UPF0148 family)
VNCPKCRATIFKPADDGYICTCCGTYVLDDITPPAIRTVTVKLPTETESSERTPKPLTNRELRRKFIAKHFDRIDKELSNGTPISRIRTMLVEFGRHIDARAIMTDYISISIERKN